MKKAVQAVLLEYRNHDSLESHGKFLDFLSKQGFDADLCVVNNGTGRLPADTNSIRYIRGSNTHHEFSGWQEAIEVLKTTKPSGNTPVILANDTWSKEHNLKLIKNISKEEFDSWVKSYPHFLAGILDRADSNYAIGDLSSDRWIRTCFFITTWADLEKIGSLTPAMLSRESLFPKASDRIFSSNSMISSGLQDRIAAWLVKDHEKSGLDNKWDQAFANLTSENIEAVRSKALSVVLEFYISARANSLGFKLIDFRRSKARGLGTYWLIDKLGMFETLQDTLNNFKR